MWRIIFKKIFPVVMTIDQDGTVRFSFAHNINGEYYCKIYTRWIKLNHDGTVSKSWIVKWKFIV